MISSPEETKRTKHANIVETLRADLLKGKYAPGARLPSDMELVRRYGASRLTVMKAVQRLEQEGLVRRRPGSGTFAIGPVADEGRTFGLLIPDLGQTEIFEPICRGMMRSPSVKNHSLSWGHALSTSEHQEEEAEHLCQSYIDQKVTGVFFAPLEFSEHREGVNERILAELTKARIPVVLLDRDLRAYPDRSTFDLVGLDNRRAGFLVTDHLIRQGAKRVAFFAVERVVDTVDDRAAGYREALFAHKLSIQPELIFRGDPSDRAFVEKALKTTRADAFLCANDRTAANLMKTLLGLGLRIPEDVRMAGIDDVRYANLLPVPLTSFHQPCADIGSVSMAAMLERVQNPHLPPRTIRLDGYLVVRGSCGATPVERTAQPEDSA